MYLYFDKKGTLKEIINDEALRQGNLNINKMYVYVEDRAYDNIDASYTLPSKAIVGPMNYNDFEEDFIPFDAKRDLRYFKYNQKYNFCVVDLSEAEPGEDENTLGDSPLDEAGVVHCNLAIMLDDAILALGEVNFMVEKNSAIEQGVVGVEKYLSLSNYLYLRSLIKGYVPYENATDDVDLGDHILKAKEIRIVNNYRNITVDDNGDLIITNGEGAIVLSGDDPVYAGANTPAAQVAVFGNLPSKSIIGQFSTGDFTLSDGGNYVATNIPLSGFISGSDLIIITWDNCFAICPVPVTGPGRVVAAMWNANGEAQTIRLRYELKTNNTLLDISLQGGFTPPSDHTAYVICYHITQS